MYIIPVNLYIFISVVSALFMIEACSMCHLMENYTFIITVRTEVKILNTSVFSHGRYTAVIGKKDSSRVHITYSEHIGIDT